MKIRYIVFAIFLSAPVFSPAQTPCKDPVYVSGWQEAHHCEGELAEFKVVATDVVTYKWQAKAPGTTSWFDLSSASSNTSTLSFIANRGGNNYEYRCRMTGNCGTVIYNTIQFFAFVYLPAASTTPVITSPTAAITQTALEGTTAKLSVSATQLWGYQWQYSPSATADWMSLSGQEASTLSLEANLDRNGYRYRCLLEGCPSKFSPVITLSVTPNPVATEYSYIRETILLKEADAGTDVAHLPVEDRAVNTSYFDGLGRIIESVSWQASPSKHDIIQPSVYDKYGREPRKYLPFSGSQTTGAYVPAYDVVDRVSGNYVGTAQAFYAPGSANGVADDDKPWAETVFEPSPLNRVIKQGAPGAAWQPDAQADDHTVRYKYTGNAASDVLWWIVVDDACQLAAQRYYDVNQLFLTETRDENWKAADGNNGVVKEYKDKQGQVILKRVYQNNQAHDTYFVYDALNNLRFVLPPEASERARQMLTQP